MWWFILIALLLLLVVYVLFVPMVLFIDTANNTYYLQLKGLLKANLLADDVEIIKIKLRLLFFNFHFYPLKSNKDSKKVNPTKKKLSKRNSRPVEPKKIVKLIKTFKVKQFYLNLDTGNCITNAKLYPVFSFLNYYKGGGFNINFKGQNKLILAMENRPIRIIKSIINN